MNRCVKRRYHWNSQCSNCSTKYFSSGAILFETRNVAMGTKRNRNDPRSRMNLFEQRQFFRDIVSDRVPPHSSLVCEFFFYLPFFFFFSFHVSTLLPFERRETSRTNSPHPSALNRRLIHVATMKEEKCFVLAINNNEIHPVDVPCERYYSFSPSSLFFSPSLILFLFSLTRHNRGHLFASSSLSVSSGRTW